ncbi:MAG: isoamylase early set domain-containing protein [Elusimicrobiota bacterium]
MDCKDIIKIISRDVLSDAEKILLEEHVEKCLSCSKKYLYLNNALSLLKDDIVMPPADFTQKVMSRAEPQDGTSAERPFVPEFMTAQWFRRLVPVAVVPVILIAGIGLLWRLKTTKPMADAPKEIVITFKVAVPWAQTVSLAGDFNSWDIESTKLERQDGFWQTTISIPQGRYQYVFIIDGKTWLPDPSAKNYVDSGYGTKNSVVDTTRL